MDESQNSGSGSGSVEQLSKSLVRYALSCEYARKPIKRQDVNEKGGTRCCILRAGLTIAVLGSHARLFKSVFEQANSELMDVFGMTMAELPKGEKVTARQKRGRSCQCMLCYTANSIQLQQDQIPKTKPPTCGCCRRSSPSSTE